MVYHRLMKIWNQDHFDHYRLYTSFDGEIGYAIFKCEQGESHERNVTGFSHSLPTVAVVDEGVGTMNYTRAEAIEMRKQEIQDRIDELIKARDSFPESHPAWLALDKEIDNLLAEKDAVTAGALPAQLFRSESDAGEPTPFISGGEVTYREPYRPASEGDEEIPY